MKTAIRWMMIGAAALVAIGCASHSHATVRTQLGERIVSDRAEFDVIHVGKRYAGFRSLSLKVVGAPVEFKRVVVHFKNGDTQKFERNVLVRAGGVLPKIDLDGGRRLLDKVVFYYEARSPGRRAAKIKLFGVR